MLRKLRAPAVSSERRTHVQWNAPSGSPLQLARGACARLSAVISWVALMLGLLVLAPVAQAAEPIKIGFTMSLTGGFSSSGKPALVAMKIWEEDINARGGLLGRPVKLVYYDDQSTPSSAPSLYSKLLDVDHVDLPTEVALEWRRRRRNRPPVAAPAIITWGVAARTASAGTPSGSPWLTCSCPHAALARLGQEWCRPSCRALRIGGHDATRGCVDALGHRNWAKLAVKTRGVVWGVALGGHGLPGLCRMILVHCAELRTVEEAMLCAA